GGNGVPVRRDVLREGVLRSDVHRERGHDDGVGEDRRVCRGVVVVVREGAAGAGERGVHGIYVGRVHAIVSGGDVDGAGQETPADDRRDRRGVVGVTDRGIARDRTAAAGRARGVVLVRPGRRDVERPRDVRHRPRPQLGQGGDVGGGGGHVGADREQAAHRHAGGVRGLVATVRGLDRDVPVREKHRGAGGGLDRAAAGGHADGGVGARQDSAGARGRRGLGRRVVGGVGGPLSANQERGG